MLKLQNQTVEAIPREVVKMGDIIWLRPYLGHPDPEPILRDVFDGWVDGDGIFSYLSAVTTLPWSNVETVDETSLDIAYFGNHSGGKFCSPLVKLVLNDEGVVPETARETIAKLLISKYLPNWQHLWYTNEAVYSPIHNYDMTENRHLKTADSEALKADHNTVESDNTSSQSGETDYKFGINTAKNNPQPSDRIDSTSKSTTGINREASDSQNKVGAGEEEEEIHRAGNIGVTTTQKLIQEERELWIWNFFDQVFNDIDRELALMFHDSCRV